jgi:ABC-type multidrug transport system permease subunit
MKMMINKFKEIIKKNFILLWRSKNSILTLFFGPLILIFLLGLAFNNVGLNKLSIAAYSEQYSILSNSLLERLEKNDFVVLRSLSESECIDSIKLGKNYICIIMPSNFGVYQNNELIVYIDKSKINLAGEIINLFSGEIKGKTSEISLDLTDILLERLNSAGLLSLESGIAVDELKSINIYSNDVIKKIGGDIDKIDSKISESILKISELRLKNLQGIDSKNTFKEISALIDESRSLVTELKEDAPSIQLKLEDLGTLLREIENKVDDSAILNDSYWNNMSLLVDNLENTTTKVDELKIQLSNNLVFIKQGFNKEIENLDNLQTNMEEINSSVSSIKIKDAGKIVNPIVTDIRPVVSERSHLNYIFPTLLVLIIMFGSVLLSSTASIVEKKDKAFFRNFISPASNIVFLITRYITDFAVVLLQLIIFFGISLIFLDIGGFSVFNLIFILLIVVSFFILLGILIGSMFNSEESSILFSIIVTSIMLFFSSTILPIENMTPIIYKISRFNPFVLAETALRKSIVYGLGINLILNEILFLLVWIAGIVFAILIVYRLNTRKIKKATKKFRETAKKIIFVEG